MPTHTCDTCACVRNLAKNLISFFKYERATLLISLCHHLSSGNESCRVLVMSVANEFLYSIFEEMYSSARLSFPWPASLRVSLKKNKHLTVMTFYWMTRQFGPNARQNTQVSARLSRVQVQARHGVATANGEKNRAFLGFDCACLCLAFLTYTSPLNEPIYIHESTNGVVNMYNK